MKNILFSLSAVFLLSCKTNSQQKIEVLASLPKMIKESSACEISSSSKWIWTLEDQNNQPILYGLDRYGKLKHELKLLNVENNDWEDLTSDDQGNLYIGDFGNNDNNRENLMIYKVNAEDLSKTEAKVSEIISFYYPEQKDFPPKKKNRIFDAESFFYLNNYFYVFTKNRSSDFDGTTTLYKIPNQTGKKWPAEKIGSFKTCDQYNGCAVTSAAISPDHKKVAILSSDKVWIFSDFQGDQFFSGKVKEIDLGHFSQKEGICFRDQQNLLITDESNKKTGSYLYLLPLEK